MLTPSPECAGLCNGEGGGGRACMPNCPAEGGGCEGPNISWQEGEGLGKRKEGSYVPSLLHIATSRGPKPAVVHCMCHDSAAAQEGCGGPAAEAVPA